MVSGRTVWLDQLDDGDLAALDPGMPETLARRPDVLVVGGGMVGVATAVACRAAGIESVLLVDASRLASGATGGAAGLLIPEAHHGTDPDALVELGRRGLDGWRDLEATTPGGVGFVDLDWFGLEPLPEGFMANPSPQVDWLTADQVAGLFPSLALPTRAAHIAHQGRLNPPRAVARLAASLIQVATGLTVTGLAQQAGRVTSVSTSAGPISPGAVVFATGTPPTLDGLDLRLPSNLVKGHLIVTEPTTVILPGVVAPLLVTPLEGGRLLLGGTLNVDDETTDVDTEVTDRIRADLIDALPELHGVRVTHQWSCWRPHHPDDLPVIDRIPGLANAWITSGHYRTGILMAPAVASALAEWITTGKQPSTTKAWTIQRPA